MAAKSVTRLWDRGQVYKGEECIAQVVYALEVVRDIADGIEQEEIAGQIRVVEGKRNLAGAGTLLLLLGRGRKWAFQVAEDLGAGVFKVVDASGDPVPGTRT